MQLLQNLLDFQIADDPAKELRTAAMKIIVNNTHLRTMSDESSSSSSPRSLTRPLHEEHPPAIQLPSLDGGKQIRQVVETTTSTNANSETTNQVTRPKFNATWHSPSDMPERKAILKEIVRSIRMRRPNAPSSMKMQLPIMAKKMEEALYKHAPSKQIYADLSTLEDRLEDLARKVQEHAVKLKKNREQQQQQSK